MTRRAGTIDRGMRAFRAVHRPGDCDGHAVADLLAEASQQLRDLGAVWVRQVSLDVDHHPHSTEISLTVLYDQAQPVR